MPVMAKNDRRNQKRREKQKKKRAEARKVRGSRAPVEPAPGRPRESGLAGAERWPVGECYLSENWFEQGAHLHAGFVRTAEDGRRAAAFYEIDLESRGVVEVLARGGVSEGGVQGEMARRSEEADHSMMVVDPDLVAKVVFTAVELGRTNGHADVDGLGPALRLFGGLDGSDTAAAILTGTPPPPPPKKKSLFSLLFGD